MKIVLTNRLAYTFLIFGILALVAVGINAYGGTQPTVVGHSAGELNLGAFDVSGASTGHLSLGVRDPDVTDPIFLIGENGVNTGIIYWQGTKDIFVLQANTNTNQLVLNEAGNVGIGTDTPTKRLDVNGDARVSGELVVDGVIKSETGDVIIQLG